MGEERTRTRSEYHRLLGGDRPDLFAASSAASVRGVSGSDRAALAAVLLDAYRGTVDDEGEDEADALGAIDYYLERLEPAYSVVMQEGDEIVAMCFVVVVRGRHYIDPVATAAARKRRGLGAAVVSHSLSLLHEAGIREVGAVVTDGNAASERLFTSLGFLRVGEWS